MEALQRFVDQFGLGISKEALVERAYRQLELEGHSCCIVNERYIEVDGTEYQLIKSRKQGGWIVKEI